MDKYATTVTARYPIIEKEDGSTKVVIPIEITNLKRKEIAHFEFDQKAKRTLIPADVAVDVFGLDQNEKNRVKDAFVLDGEPCRTYYHEVWFKLLTYDSLLTLKETFKVEIYSVENLEEYILSPNGFMREMDFDPDKLEELLKVTFVLPHPRR